MENSITIVGNLTRDPEIRFTTSGRAVTSFGLAVNRRYQVNGEWQEETAFHNVTCWGSLAENVAASLTKGARVFAFGRMNQRSYETDQGEKRYVYEVVADSVGPCLRWATAQVERTERERTTNAGPDDDIPPPDDAPAGGRSKGNEPIYGDDEPF